MGIIAKTLWMIAGALALLIGLGVADPGNRRLMPSFFSTDPRLGVLPKGTIDEITLAAAITRFNRDLSAAYLGANPAALTDSPMDESLRRKFGEEIAFLREEGRVLEMTVEDIRIGEVRRLPNLSLSVDTVESVNVRYLAAFDRREILARPEARYAMNYTLEGLGSEWKITGVETLDAGRRDD